MQLSVADNAIRQGHPTTPVYGASGSPEHALPNSTQYPGATLRVQHTSQPTSNASACYYLERAIVHKDVSPMIFTLLLRPPTLGSVIQFLICTSLVWLH